VVETEGRVVDGDDGGAVSEDVENFGFVCELAWWEIFTYACKLY
jgi:hypothetical protein